MLRTVIDNIKYMKLLVPLSLKNAMSNKTAFWSLNIFMFVQNLILFMMWLVYFHNFSSLKGWQPADVATLNGIAAFAFGIAFFFCGGALDLARAIMDGELDVYLGQPRHPLIGLLFRECRVAGIGDMLTAPLLWIWLGNYSALEIVLLFLLATFAGMVLLATAMVVNCLPFFIESGGRTTDQLLESFIIVSVYPQNGFGLAIKVILLTVVPAGFIAFVPVLAIREFDLWLMALCGIAGVFYLSFAVWIFNLGLKRYTSGNRMLDVR